MASRIEEVGIRLRADGVAETTAGARLTGEAMAKSGAQVSAAGKHLDQYGRTARQTSAAMAGLPAQMGDLVTQIAGGQQVWLALLQQGTQVKDMFGGLRPMLSSLASLVTPARLAVTGLGAAVGVAALAFYQGWQQSRQLANGLALSGNTAAVTEHQFNSLAVRLADAKNTTVAATRELLQVLASSGAQTSGSFEVAGRAALALAKLNGQSAADNARAFATMRDGVTDWAAKANRAYNYLTAEQYKQIQALEAQGRTSEALRLNMDALATTLESRSAPSMGLVERAANAAGNALSNMWDRIKGIGRDDTTGQRMAELRERLANWDQQNVFQRGGRSAVEQELEDLQRQEARAAQRSADRATAQQAEQDAILRAGRQFNDTLLAIDSAGAARQLAVRNDSLTRQNAGVEEAYRRGELSALAYRDRLWEIERQKLEAQEAFARASIGIEQSRVVKSEMEANSRTAAVRQAEARLKEVESRRVQLEADMRAGKLDPKLYSQGDNAQTTFRRTELGNDGYAATARAMAEQHATALQAAHELAATNQRLNTELIRDDSLRAQAQLALEERAMRERLDLQAGSADDRRLKEEALANWLLLRQRKLAEDLKPEWQRMLEGWQNTTQLMRDSSNSLFTGFLRDGEDAFVQLMTKGTINVRSLVTNMMAEFARLQFRQWAASQSQSLGGLFGTLFTMFAGSSAGGAGAAGNAGYGDYAAFGQMINAGANHAGGLATEPTFRRLVPARTFAGAPRAHTGIGPGELPAIIKQDEGVFTKGQMKALAPVEQVAKARGTGARVNFAPTINVDARSDRAQVVQLVREGMQQSQRELMDMMERGMA